MMGGRGNRDDKKWRDDVQATDLRSSGIRRDLRGTCDMMLRMNASRVLREVALSCFLRIFEHAQ